MTRPPPPAARPRAPPGRQVTLEEGDASARELGVEFTETSAKAGFNIKALFRKIAVSLPSTDDAGGEYPAAGGPGRAAPATVQLEAKAKPAASACSC